MFKNSNVNSNALYDLHVPEEASLESVPLQKWKKINWPMWKYARTFLQQYL